MCTSTPKPKTVKEKEPQYMRNPWLDSLTMNRAATVGRNSLRTDSSRRITPTSALPPPMAPFMPPPIPRDPSVSNFARIGGNAFATMTGTTNPLHANETRRVDY